MEVQPPAIEPKAWTPAGRSREILDSAIKLFAAQGYGQTEVQEIADRVGIGKGTVYRHFGNKESLFLAAVAYARDQLIAAVDDAQDASLAPLERLRVCMTAILRFFDARPEVVELLIEERALFRDRRPSLFFEQDEQRRREWGERLTAMIDAGAIRNLPVAEIQDTLSRFVFGAMFFHYFAGKTRPLADHAQTMFDVLFHGLLAPAVKLPPAAADRSPDTKPPEPA
ncbi:MAG: TetR family transcriptional regulator [Planctomycetota bacterium]|nr:MAG: TetR family transcriptional regulator [Planctomycetota bacterium]